MYFINTEMESSSGALREAGVIYVLHFVTLCDVVHFDQRKTGDIQDEHYK